ncbi:unnamed protein product [Larinioides sclopetarius]|uniref:RRM domain-containing protein n=1 Tax=Larinioides sclopetarius TaxID=280406 RepID=A0AAV1ZVW2_9ARAC
MERKQTNVLNKLEAIADRLQPASGSMSALGEQPDPDTIKMFVGQVPRHWNESDLTKIFEEFGPVYQISVLRDKITQQSRVSTSSGLVSTYHLVENSISHFEIMMSSG